MSRHPDYNAAAYLASICDEIERRVVDEYVDETSSGKRVLICEHVLFADREVPPGSWHEFLGMIRGLGKQARQRMDEFELRRKDDPGYRLGETDERAGKGRVDQAARRPGDGPAAGGAGVRPRGTHAPPRKARG